MFAGKVVWITGASSGIGEELANQLAKEKAKLILSSRRVDELERVKKECISYTNAVEILPLDLSDITSLKTAADSAILIFGKIDILINCGGISQRSSALETNAETEQRIMNINFFSAVNLSKFVLPQMQKNGYGKIVLISSITGKIGVPNRSTYSASKHALIGYFDSMRAELAIARSPINIHLIMPGFIHTNISYHAVTGDGKEQGVLDPGQEHGMPVDICVRKIISAIKKNKKEVLIGGKEIWMVYFRRFVPSLYYKLIPRVQTK
ncbi:MAG: SDR family oxidoreductase [Chitinophagales bacterium]